MVVRIHKLNGLHLIRWTLSQRGPVHDSPRRTSTNMASHVTSLARRHTWSGPIGVVKPFLADVEVLATGVLHPRPAKHVGVRYRVLQYTAGDLSADLPIGSPLPVFQPQLLSRLRALGRLGLRLGTNFGVILIEHLRGVFEVF
jgi:hypothetical protein